MESKISSNKFLELASSPLMNLDHTYRYSGTRLVEAESLSQHIVDTIMMGLKIIDKVNNISGKLLVDPATYVMKAVYHDIEEVITGDIPRPVKYFSTGTRRSLKDVADKVASKFFNEQFSDGYPHYSMWDNAKKGDAGYILKIVDTLVVANKVIKEVNLLNNYYMLRVAHEVSQYLREIKRVDYFYDIEVNSYLSEILNGAIVAMEDILEEHRDIMDKLNIHSHSMI